MALNTHYKPNYTEEECEECFQWFEQHMDELPPTLESIRSLRIMDLPHTIRRMINILRHNMGSIRTFGGEFALLQLIREKLIEEGSVKE